MFLLKLRELTWIISKFCIYYKAFNNKYYLIASYLLGKPTNSRTRQKIQQNLMKCIKVQNQSGTKPIRWDSSRSIKWIYFVKKRLVDNALHKNIMESIRRKIVSLISLGSNKVCVVSLTIFFNFLKLCLLKSLSKKNYFKKWKMLITKISSILGGLRQRGIR